MCRTFPPAANRTQPIHISSRIGRIWRPARLSLAWITSLTLHLDLIQAFKTTRGFVGCFDHVAVTIARLAPTERLGFYVTPLAYDSCLRLARLAVCIIICLRHGAGTFVVSLDLYLGDCSSMGGFPVKQGPNTVDQGLRNRNCSWLKRVFTLGNGSTVSSAARGIEINLPCILPS